MMFSVVNPAWVIRLLITGMMAIVITLITQYIIIIYIFLVSILSVIFVVVISVLVPTIMDISFCILVIFIFPDLISQIFNVINKFNACSKSEWYFPCILNCSNQIFDIFLVIVLYNILVFSCSCGNFHKWEQIVD